MDIAAKSSSTAAVKLVAASPSPPPAAAWLGREAAFWDDAMEGQAEADLRNSESEEEGAARVACSPSTKVKSDPKESLGAFH